MFSWDDQLVNYRVDDGSIVGLLMVDDRVDLWLTIWLLFMVNYRLDYA